METNVIIGTNANDYESVNEGINDKAVRANNYSPLHSHSTQNHSRPIQIIEHDCIPNDYHDCLKDIKFEGNPTNYMGEPKYLGIDANLRASFYIGASWLKKHELAVVVTPKMPNIDFVKMFVAALEVDTRNESDYFAKCYGIHFDEPQIDADTRLSQLTPMLVLHYIALLDRLAKRGLRRSYITREENLKAKVKGRIMLGRHLRQNVFQQRDDRFFCQYQEFTDDTPENRLLKRALMFAEGFIDGKSGLRKKIEGTEIPKRLRLLKSKFEHISDRIEPYQIQHLATNKLYREYREAIGVAKMLLRRFDYSIAKATSEPQKTPPFWIDMARLYEMWVYSKLSAAYGLEIAFQVKGHFRTAVDFIKKDEGIILDAKYKPHYEGSNRGIIDDIREMSGYARDTRILHALGAANDGHEVKCVIIYPESRIFESEKDDDSVTDDECIELKFDGSFDGSPIIPKCSEIKQFRGFYKVSVPLPLVR